MVMGTAKHATACLITHHILQRKFLVNRDISEKTARSGCRSKGHTGNKYYRKFRT